MKHIYFCDQNKSKEIVLEIPTKEPYVEYEASIFEDHLVIDFFTGNSRIITHAVSLITLSFDDERSEIALWDGKSFARLSGYFYVPELHKIAEVLSFSPDFVLSLEKSGFPSCPIEVISNVDKNRDRLMSEFVGSNVVDENEW